MSNPSFVSVTRMNGRPLELDIFQPPQEKLGCAVVLLHGGGWMFGHRRDTYAYARELAAAGITAIAAGYRLLSEAAWPAQLQDVKDVVIWCRMHAAELGVSADKIVLQGFSAGGHLALMAAATPHRSACGETTAGEPVAAVVTLFAPPALRLPPADAGPHPVRALLGTDATEADAAAASPLTHIGPLFPPTFIIHGTRDCLIPHQAALTLFGTLDRANVPVELHLHQGQGHEFASLPSAIGPVMAEIVQFLKRTVVDPAAHEREHRELNPFANGPPPGPPAGGTANLRPATAA